MDKIFNLKVLMGLLILISLMDACRTRNIRKDISRLKAANDSLEQTLSRMYTRDEMDDRMKIQSLEQEKSVLYNVNYIVLTKQRPDQRMNEIDKEIDRIKAKLNK